MHICMHGPYSPPFFPDPLDFLVLMLMMMMMLEGYNIYICIYICYSTYQESGAEIIIPAPDHGNAVKYCTQHLLPPSRCSKHDFRPTVTRPFAYLTSQLSSLFSVNGFPTFPRLLFSSTNVVRLRHPSTRPAGYLASRDAPLRVCLHNSRHTCRRHYFETEAYRVRKKSHGHTGWLSARYV